MIWFCIVCDRRRLHEELAPALPPSEDVLLQCPCDFRIRVSGDLFNQLRIQQHLDWEY